MGMTRARCAALLLTAGMLLAGCSDGGDSGAMPEMFTEKPTMNAAICSDPDLSPEAWAAVCKAYGQQPTKAPAPTELAFGQTATTAGKADFGQKEAGRLDVAPATVAYTTRPDGGEYLVVAVTLTNPLAVAAQPQDGTSGGGWTYTAPDGEQFKTGASLVVNGFNNAWFITVAPGLTESTIQAWSIRPDQRGGVLQFVDGAYKVYRWQLPAVDTGPQVEQVKKGL